MICFPNAKINLGLRIVEKRPDGFHNIESVFLPIPFSDSLEVIPTKKPDITVYEADFNIPKEQNLVWKAYQLLRTQINIPPIHIHLLKNIPSGGGLGGGSADVGFLLRLLNDQFQLNLSYSTMEKWALKLGSDCPYFLHNKPMRIYGRGEKMQVVDFSFKAYCILIFNNIHISTKEAYAGIIPKKPEQSPYKILHLPELWKTEMKNDFEKPVYSKFPELKRIIQELYDSGAFYASLTGTGGAQYAFFRKQPILSKKLQDKIIWQGNVSWK